MIEINKLEKSYIIWWESTPILKWIDLKINKWDFVSIMWPSWSGKSTLMNMIWILDTPTGWEYYFDGTNVAWFTEDEQASFRRDKIWFIFQWYNLLPRLPAWSQVALPLSYKWRWSDRRYKRAIEVLTSVGLWDRTHHTPDMLSWWQQQRVCIARALACDPALLLADEPTWALDSVTSWEILNLFKTLSDGGKSIVMITHDREVAQVAHRIVYIKDGLIDNQKN
jgi:putative ABC transport system ATP-binding protein